MTTTGEKIIAFIAIAIGLGFLTYATIGRILGFHRPTQWSGGWKVSFIGELSIAIFILCWGLTILLNSSVFIIPIVVAFTVGFISQSRSHQQYIAKNKKLREENAAKYPGIFDNSPPSDINSITENEIDLFDAGSCTYLGRVSKNDVKLLIERFKEIPEQGPNDIYMLVESIEMLPKGSVSHEFITLLKKAFKNRDYLEIRWMAPTQGTKTLQ